jgi:hypothetical protein
MDKKEKCPFLAHVRYTWPGRDEAFACIYHARAIQTVSKAMGFPLQMISVNANPAVTCDSSDDLPDEIKEG